MKKISDRKGNARPRHTNSSLQSDSPGTCSTASLVNDYSVSCITTISIRHPWTYLVHFSVQSEDDHEELLAAANAALSIDFTFAFCSF